jgi:hypothetical protein
VHILLGVVVLAAVPVIGLGRGRRGGRGRAAAGVLAAAAWLARAPRLQ